jgi:fumarylacetoacetate (FAA) hydrolase
MKFISFKTKTNKNSWGVLAPNNKILDLSNLKPDLLQFISDSQWPQKIKDIEALYKNADIDPTQVTLLSPLPRPASLRDGYAFRQHVEASRKNRGLAMIPEFEHFPVFYYGNHFAVTGPGDVPMRDKVLDRLDFELEAAIVIGKEGRNISAKEADDYIFGYMIMNDWSARGWWQEEFKMSMGPAKAKDFATSLGPWLVTRDELASRASRGPNGEKINLKMKSFINGKQFSEGNVADMHWTFAQIIERASYGVTLYPGEVIGSGTCGTGCYFEVNGFEKEGKPWLKVSDEVVLEIEMLGRLENRVVKENV